MSKPSHTKAAAVRKQEMVSETNTLRWRTTQAVSQLEKDIIPAGVFGSDGRDRERKGKKMAVTALFEAYPFGFDWL